MPEFLSPELQTLRDATSALAVDTLTRLRDDPNLDPTDRAARVRAASKAAGLYELTQSDDTPALTLLVVRETLASHGVASLPGLFGAEAGVLKHVGEPLRTSHLLPMLAGDKRGGFAITEPSDVPRRTWATVDGEHLLVTGQKSYVTGGGDADFLTALVDIESQGPSMVIIDTDLEGVTLTRRFASLDGSHHAAFQFREVRVPRANVIGAPGDGRARALDKISGLRRAVAADCVGSMMWILDQVAADLRRARRGSGGGSKGGSRSGSISETTSKAELERVRLRLGELRILGYAARSMVYRTARLADAGHNVVNETIAAKVFASETANQVVDAAIQLIGGEALVIGHPIEVAMRRLRIMRLVEGDSDTLRVNLSRGYLDLDKGRL